jgi:purine-nucleoside/S-methyl-5'-thioadenosine phosphorylase / adenosine deaminase
VIYDQGTKVFRSQLIPILHGFTTREWGNLGYGKNPGDPEVTANRLWLFDTLKVRDRKHIQPKQIHSATVVDANSFTPGQEGDASYTNSSQHLLSVLTADCIPILFYHPDGVAAVTHAGWRGLLNGIIPATLSVIPKNPVAVLGPAIGTCCYEVSEELAKDFADRFGESVVDRNFEKPHLDLVSSAIKQLQECGVSELEASDFCTYCHPDLFFSFRRDGSSGRQMAYIAR